MIRKSRRTARRQATGLKQKEEGRQTRSREMYGRERTRRRRKKSSRRRKV